MLREGGPAGIWTRDLSIASPTPYRSANTQVSVVSLSKLKASETFVHGLIIVAPTLSRGE